MTSEIRRYKDHLTVSGAGVIVFSFWSLIKTMVYYMRPSVMASLMEDMGLEFNKRDVALFLIAIFCTMAVITAMRIYTGRAAIREGRSGKKGTVYIVLSFVLILESIYTITGYVEQIEEVENDVLFSSLLEEMVSILISCDLLFSVWKVRMSERGQG